MKLIINHEELQTQPGQWLFFIIFQLWSVTCSFNITLKLQAGFPEHLTMEPNPERYLYITLIVTIVTEDEMFQKTICIMNGRLNLA